MSLKALVVSKSVQGKVQSDDYEVVDLLGESENALAVRLDEVLRVVSESVRGSITGESQLTVEISGSISLKGGAGGKFLFLNVGGEAGKTDTLKVTLATKVLPQQRT